MNKTSIEWTDYTSNLIRYRDPEGRSVHGCIKVSAGCANCYASAISKRFSGGEFTASRQKTLTPYFDDAEAQRILRTRVTGKRVFVGDMTDVFGEWVPDDMLDRMFAVFALRPDLTFQVLTKRPERMREYMVDPDCYTCVDEAAAAISGESGVGVITRWPLPNVWLGVSVEDQAAADARIPELLDTPAAVRFLSCEPLLGQLMLRRPFVRDHKNRNVMTEDDEQRPLVPGSFERGEITRADIVESPADAVQMFRDFIFPFDADLSELRGKDLACWCALDQPCHADVLLEWANAPEWGAE